ncbi:mCG145253, partial [Mus musculus]
HTPLIPALKWQLGKSRLPGLPGPQRNLSQPTTNPHTRTQNEKSCQNLIFLSGYLFGYQFFLLFTIHYLKVAV